MSHGWSRCVTTRVTLSLGTALRSALATGGALFGAGGIEGAAGESRARTSASSTGRIPRTVLILDERPQWIRQSRNAPAPRPTILHSRARRAARPQHDRCRRSDRPRGANLPGMGIQDVLAKQDGVISRRQVREIGETDADIERRLSRREWARIHPGVTTTPGRLPGTSWRGQRCSTTGRLLLRVRRRCTRTACAATNLAMEHPFRCVSTGPER